MDLMHLHLMLNHVPVVGTLFLVALFGVAAIRKDSATARIALWTCVAIAAVAGIVFLTGESAEESVEHLAGTSRAAIELHEDVAAIALLVMGAAGALALAAIGIYRRKLLPRWISLAGVGFSVLLLGTMGVTANLGGQIRHSELRGTATAQSDTGVVRGSEDEDGRR